MAVAVAVAVGFIMENGFQGGFWSYCFLYSIIGVESERGIAKYQ